MILFIAKVRFLPIVQSGFAIQRDVEVDGPTRAAMNLKEVPKNPLMLQGDHGPVAYRNVHWRALREIIEG